MQLQCQNAVKILPQGYGQHWWSVFAEKGKYKVTGK